MLRLIFHKKRDFREDSIEREDVERALGERRCLRMVL